MISHALCLHVIQLIGQLVGELAQASRNCIAHMTHQIRTFARKIRANGAHALPACDSGNSLRFLTADCTSVCPNYRYSILTCLFAQLTYSCHPVRTRHDYRVSKLPTGVENSWATLPSLDYQTPDTEIDMKKRSPSNRPLSNQVIN